MSASPKRKPQRYPTSSALPQPFVDLSSRAERERLSGPALRAFFNLVSRWELREADARELLGGVSSSTYYEWKRKPERTLEVDRITRISYLVGIYKALHILYGDKLADEWVKLPNQNALFGGRTPLEAMCSGGLLAMQVVRQLLDARRGAA